MEVRGLLHLWLGIEEWVVGQNVAAARGVFWGLEAFGARMWCLVSEDVGDGRS